MFVFSNSDPTLKYDKMVPQISNYSFLYQLCQKLDSKGYFVTSWIQEVCDALEWHEQTNKQIKQHKQQRLRAVKLYSFK